MWQQRPYPSGACTSYRCSWLCSSTAMSRPRSTPRRLQSQSRAATRRYPARARLGDRIGSGRTLSDRMCCAVLRERCDSAGAARVLYGMCMFSRAGEGRRQRVGACACARMCARKCKCRVSVSAVCARARRDGGACGMVDSRYGRWQGSGFLGIAGYPDKGPRKLGDGVIGAAVVGAAVVGAAVLVVVHSGWLAA